MKIYESYKENLIFVGDIHGDFKSVVEKLEFNKIENSTIIICGDIGLGFSTDMYYYTQFHIMDEILHEYNNEIFMFRGNHDNKDYFDGKHFTDFENIHIIPDYSVIKTSLYNILCIGGAVSIDRKTRIEGKSYWKNEVNIFENEQFDLLKESGINVDIVCTHSSPSFCSPNTTSGIQYWLDRDSKLEEDVNLERQVNDMILMRLREDGHKIQNWYYGHFHNSNTEYVDGIKYVMLDILEFVNLYN